MSTRICNNCNETRTLDRYYGSRKKCKNCLAAEKREKQRKNPEKYKQAMRKWYETKGRKWKKEYEQKNRDHINQRDRERYKKDPVYRNKKILRTRLSSTIYGTKKYNKILHKLGIEHDMFLNWLEFQFSEDMNWENQGTYWGIDHVIPIDYYVKNEDNEESLHHWSNLRPCKHLGKDGNFAKNNKIDLCLIKDHLCITVPSFAGMMSLDLDIVVQRLQRKWVGGD